ncbi:MAG: cytochrome C peroxidase [Saprospiraceae bacterium]|nr:cytochrome C peroxidase [Saprospiraceae bacterium]MBK8483431.1 cytochrome C peroxidase [Saprospiraceae bacterium]MBK9220940.1 cytochrome C peroxidase [Saprospiraceae bacterium]MBK9722215.1 cytochrome C peroxidase [Saprospiraceae bacterium]MBK9729236.1 cytochrome C peroxidase [Saprospiraceae bacterium]
MRSFKIGLLAFLLLFGSCQDDPKLDLNDLSQIAYNPVEYPLIIPKGLPILPDFINSPLTKDQVQLGRHLFYDPILSSDSTMSCASCHNPRKAFTDNLPFSPGVTGAIGNRSSMTILNAAYYYKGLFWDGRSINLEAQAIEPVQNPIELHELWPNVEAKLKRHPVYPEMFRKAFGISSKTMITKELATKAIAQFERILLTGGNSLYHKQVRGEVFFDPDQQEGHDLFFNTDLLIPDAECFHCHAAPLFQANEFFNNGIDTIQSIDDFNDKGRGEITKLRFDNGKFKATSLFNIALTAPYMHDGRFQTLEEVIEHYNSGGHYAENKDGFIRPLGLNKRQKQNLVLFLKTLTDTSYLQNPDILSPF